MVPTSTRAPEFGPCTPPSAAPRPPAERVTVRQGFWRQQVEEIRADPALRASGVVLALVHLLGAIHWLAGGAASLLQRGAEPICWPLVPWCAEMRSFSAAELRWLLAGYAAAALGTAALFAHRRSVGWASVALAGLIVVKLFVLALDYRLRLNQHYMGVTVMLVFLAIPAKRDALRVLLALVYFWAGTLKL